MNGTGVAATNSGAVTSNKNNEINLNTTDGTPLPAPGADLNEITASTYLSIALTPANPTILSTAALGSVVAKITATWSDGSPFTGTIAFGSPNSNDGGVYAIDSSNNLIINPTGPGVGSAGGSVQNVTIVATQ